MALLDFPNVVRPNESNPDSETSHFAGVWTLKKSLYIRVLSNANGENELKMCVIEYF